MIPTKHILLATTLFAGFSALAPQISTAATASPVLQRLAETGDNGGGGEAIATAPATASAVLAQSAAQSPSATPSQISQADKTATSVKEVVVTGSRIAHVSTDTPQPVEVITGQDMQDRGFTNIADILDQLPAMGAGVTPIGGQDSFGTGFNYVDLFSLGSNRTLTLVNGLRFIGDNPNNIFSNAGGTQVDLNALPTLFVDHIDTVLATGAAVYGSDAISGVVNVVMKKQFEGEAFNVQSGVSTYGDTPRYTVEAAIGHNFLDGKLNIAGDFMYDRTNELSNQNRPWTAAALAFSPNPGSGPAQIVTGDTRWSGITQGGLPLQPDGATPIYLPGPGGTLTSTILQFGKGGALVPYNPGTLYGPFIGGNAGGGDGFDIQPYLSLQVPLDRKVFSGMASYEVTPNFRLHANVNYSDVNAIQQADQAIYTYPGFGGVAPSFNSPFPGQAMLISLDNAFLSPQDKAALTANGVTEAGGFALSRVNTDVASIPITSTDKTFNGSLVAEGDFTALARKFTWNLDYTGGVADTTFNQSYFDYGNPSLGLPNLFGNALDSVINPATGKPICRVTLATPNSSDPSISQCVPFNPFGTGNDNAASTAYFMRPYDYAAENIQQDFQANLGTSLITLPAGDLKANFGYEHRHEQASFSPNLNSIQGTGYSVPIGPQSGKYDTNEYYVEAFAPLFGGDFRYPLLYKLELQGAWRDVQNSIAGENKSWSYGAEYSPFRDLTFRGSKSKTFRDPSLMELFSAQTSAYDAGLDPCTTANIDSGPNPKTREKNCAAAFSALGVPLSSFSTSLVQTQTIPVTSGGNPDLKNEIGNSFTYGAILQPRWVPGLTMSADYIEINITNAIEYYGVGQAMETCYDDPVYPNPACSLFNRANGTSPTPGQVLTAHEGFVNAGFNRFAGANYNLYYDRAINQLPFVRYSGDLGRFTMNFNAMNIRRSINSVSGLGFDDINTAGTVGTGGASGQPRWRWTSTFAYTKGPLRLGWTSHWIQSSAYDLTFTAANQEPLTVKDNLTHDLSVGYKITPTLTLKLNVNNVFNTPPPSPVGTYTVGYYDFIGRYFLFGLSGKF